MPGGVFPHTHGSLPAARLLLLGAIAIGGDGAHLPPFHGARP